MIGELLYPTAVPRHHITPPPRGQEQAALAGQTQGAVGRGECLLLGLQGVRVVVEGMQGVSHLAEGIQHHQLVARKGRPVVILRCAALLIERTPLPPTLSST